jgi:hypothetical protein
MATWKADVFVNSRVGRITTEVEAATFQGAKEQIYARHGDVQQITNLRQVSSGGGLSSGGSDTDASGMLILGAILFCIWLLVEYWWIVVPSVVILGILYYLGTRE